MSDQVILGLISNDECEPDQEAEWIGLFKSGSNFRVVMTGHLIDGSDVVEVGAIVNKTELKKLRDFIDRHLSEK